MNKFNLSIDAGIKENENNENNKGFVLGQPPKFLSINTGANDNNPDAYIPYDPLAARKQKKKRRQKKMEEPKKRQKKKKERRRRERKKKSKKTQTKRKGKSRRPSPPPRPARTSGARSR